MRMRNRAYDAVYAQNNAAHVRFVGSPDWFARAGAYAGADRSVFPILRADARARRELAGLHRDVQRARARLLPALAPSILASPNVASDEALLQRVMIRMDDPVARRRLARAWLTPLAARREDTNAVLSRLVESRWRTAAADGAASPLEASRAEDVALPPGADLTAFIARYAVDAAARRRALADAIGAANDGGASLLDYPALVWRQVRQHGPVQLLGKRAVDLARFLLGESLDCLVGTTRSPEGVLLSLSDGTGRVFGYVQLDLSLAGRVTCTESPASVAGDPVGRVLLRCTPSSRGLVTTYEAFFLFVHELGHAMAHVLGAARSRYRGPWSGLLYGPLVHAESVSTLTEKLALHPDLDKWFEIASPEEAASLRARQKVASLEFLKNEGRQVAVAWADCLAQGGGDRTERGPGEVLPGLPIGSWPPEWEIAPYLVTQLLARHPGAGGAVYLISNAYSCGVFETVRDQSFDGCVRSVGAYVNHALSHDQYPALGKLDGGPISRINLSTLND
jgi:hypothetical protein